ncbi:Aste57867_10460 [Aphanomyces stellatus]|uniref:Aste57867_10460 protein n=1 Tax=Aphanomyces stellatus TaxID=120398 RepID=A0A485KQE7_9STRA|nr:hypothetical protein As57867_010420 [Aphanomyces stellatus]VFT87334.1 Aste57867_10460 [Aphanomyces stellatus]
MADSTLPDVRLEAAVATALVLLAWLYRAFVHSRSASVVSTDAAATTDVATDIATEKRIGHVDPVDTSLVAPTESTPHPIVPVLPGNGLVRPLTERLPTDRRLSYRTLRSSRPPLQQVAVHRQSSCITLDEVSPSSSTPSTASPSVTTSSPSWRNWVLDTGSDIAEDIAKAVLFVFITASARYWYGAVMMAHDTTPWLSHVQDQFTQLLYPD